ncbi:MAG: hypothetical protein IJ061_04830 [Lachnospiraceae bacterium]|nr:hypothetical protein [Lachnospiraceae bacterium]
MEPVIYVSGTPYEQGVQEGKLLKEIIERNVSVILGKLEREHLTDNAAYDAFVENNLDFLRRENRSVYDEIQGISDGSGISLENIIKLNIPAYFMAGSFLQECSMILARGSATLDHKTYVIKNRDMSIFIEQILLHRTYPDGMKIVEITGAGTTTYPACGMNSFGLGVTNTGFWSRKVRPDAERPGSGHVFLNAHNLLEKCRTAREALEEIRNTPRLNGLNVIVADPADAFLVEMTKNDCHVTADDGCGLLYHTNHYTTEGFADMNPEREEYPSTFMRYERIGELLKASYGTLRFQDMYRIMSDHANGVNAICRHPQPGAPAQTISSSMFVLEDMEAWTTIDNPCMSIRHAPLG